MRNIDRTFKRWREQCRRRAAIGELRALSDHALKDMGLTRGEIVAAVDGSVYRGETVPPGPDPSPTRQRSRAVRSEPIEAAALQRHIEHARQLRAVFIGGLLCRGLGSLSRLLRQLRHPCAESGTAAACEPTARSRLQTISLLHKP